MYGMLYVKIFFIHLLLVLKVQALESNYFLDKKFETPRRELSIIVSKEGYYPQKPTVYVGEKIHLYVTSTINTPSCFIIKNKDVYVAAQMGEINEAEVVFTKPGIYESYCPAGQKRGKIVVLEHPAKRKARVARQLASKKDKKVKIWRPKDE